MDRNELTSSIWRACDIMRSDGGTSGVLAYMEQLSWLIFLKIFEDLEKRFEQEAKLANTEYKVIIEKRYRWSSWAQADWKGKKLMSFIDDELFPYLRSLSGTDEKRIIAIIFNEIQGNKMKGSYNLKEVISLIDYIDFNDPEDSHVVSQIYEELLLRMGKEGGVAGEFYTPRPVIRLMVKIINPILGETIFDPFCGSGGFLVESFKRMKKTMSVTVDNYQTIQKSTFYGQEKMTLPYLLGVMNCILQGILTPNIDRKNTLESDIRHISESDRFDVIITNPPFGGKEGHQIRQNFPIQSSSTELLALQYVMKKLKACGRCGIVLPESMLSAGGSFASVRKELIESFNLHTIISLPAGVFANVTPLSQGPKTNLLFFDREGLTDKIWYYEVPDPKTRKYSRANPITDRNLEDCFKKFTRRSISVNSWVVDIKQVISRDYDLTAKNPNQKETNQLFDLNDVLNELHTHQQKIKEITIEIKKSLKKLEKDLDVPEVKMSELLTHKKNFFKISDDEEYNRITIKLHGKGIYPRDKIFGSKIKTKKQQRVITNDLVVAEIDAKVGGFGILPQELDQAIVSSHYFVYSVDTRKIDLKYLEFYLRTGKPTQDIQAFVKGSLNYASVRPNAIMELKIPLPNLDKQRLIAKIFRNIKSYKNSIRKVDSDLENMIIGLLQSLLSKKANKLSKECLENENR